MRKFKVRRVVGYAEGYTLITVFQDHIQFYYGDTMQQGAKDINVTKIIFKEHTLNVLETPEQIDGLVEGYRNEYQ